MAGHLQKGLSRTDVALHLRTHRLLFLPLLPVIDSVVPVQQPAQMLLELFWRSSAKSSSQTPPIWSDNHNFLLPDSHQSSVFEPRHNNSVGIGLEDPNTREFFLADQAVGLTIDWVLSLFWLAI